MHFQHLEMVPVSIVIAGWIRIIKRRPLVRLVVLLPVLAATCLVPNTIAAHLKPETIQAWNDFIDDVDARNQKRVSPGGSFLWSDEISGQIVRLRRGDIVVAPASSHVPHKVPSGLIHDWIGAIFISGVTLDEVMTVVRSYERYKDFYHPTVIDSRLISREGLSDQFWIRLVSKSFVVKTALDAEFQSSHTSQDRRWYSITRSTRIREVAEYGTASQHTLPEDEGKGLIWRLHSVARFEERDGGVYIEVEAIALSRDIPGALRWLIGPMVRRVSVSSLVTSLRQTQAAVRSLRESQQPGVE
jgi:hypothetical protein